MRPGMRGPRLAFLISTASVLVSRYVPEGMVCRVMFSNNDLPRGYSYLCRFAYTDSKLIFKAEENGVVSIPRVEI